MFNFFKNRSKFAGVSFSFCYAWLFPLWPKLEGMLLMHTPSSIGARPPRSPFPILFLLLPPILFSPTSSNNFSSPDRKLSRRDFGKTRDGEGELMKIPFLEIGLMNFAGCRGGILIKISPGKGRLPGQEI